MDPFDGAEADTIVAGYGDWIGPDELTHLATHPLSCIQTEYPHYAHSVDGRDGHVRPSTQHPIFYGCFDWHSAVHSHWSLIRQLRLFEDHPMRQDIIEVIDSTVTERNAEVESSYLKEHPRFERPYGWGWFLRLVAELDLWDDPVATSWRSAFVPLEETIVSLVTREFLTMSNPHRVGTHGNAAFGLGCVIDYARTVGDTGLEKVTIEQTTDWYLEDEGYPLEYEPLGWDFLSPGLLEAEVMARALDLETFVRWFEGFLPEVTDDRIPLSPAAVAPVDGDGMAMHLIGLNLSRAWSMASLAEVLADHPAGEQLRDGAIRHARAGLEMAFIDDYAGSHWLTSFALYLVSRNEGGIWP